MAQFEVSEAPYIDISCSVARCEVIAIRADVENSRRRFESDRPLRLIGKILHPVRNSFSNAPSESGGTVTVKYDCHGDIGRAFETRRGMRVCIG
jgi:hypothetical protein